MTMDSSQTMDLATILIILGYLDEDLQQIYDRHAVWVDVDLEDLNIRIEQRENLRRQVQTIRDEEIARNMAQDERLAFDYRPSSFIFGRPSSSSAYSDVDPRSSNSSLREGNDEGDGDAKLESIPMNAFRDTEMPDADDFYHGHSPSRRAPPSHVRQICTACSEHFPQSRIMVLQCGHEYCADCTQRMIESSLKGITAFPTRCCEEEIPFSSARDFLLFQTAQLYRERKLAHDTSNPVWCSNTSCGRIIPSDLDDGEVKCNSCEVFTCVKCKKSSHFSSCATDTDAAQEAVLRLAERQGWQKCYRCKVWVERIDGCNKIKCKCGAEFCYSCGAPSGECDCGYYGRPTPAMGPPPADRPSFAQERRGGISGPSRPSTNIETPRPNDFLGAQPGPRPSECLHESWVNDFTAHPLCEQCDSFIREDRQRCRDCKVIACEQCRRFMTGTQ